MRFDNHKAGQAGLLLLSFLSLSSFGASITNLVSMANLFVEKRNMHLGCVSAFR